MGAEKPIEDLVYYLSKMPGLGKRSARRVALHMIKNREAIMYPLAETIRNTADSIVICDSCGNIDSDHLCSVCSDEKRDDTILCIVEEVADLWAIERSRSFKGKYHILGGVLSAIDGVTPEDLAIDKLLHNLKKKSILEVIIATSATVDGQTTAHYVMGQIRELDPNITISRIAHGIPIGGELDYLDDGTLGTALNSRQPF